MTHGFTGKCTKKKYLVDIRYLTVLPQEYLE